jgi:asparagine synthase (glutamine-hydrolysing)
MCGITGIIHKHTSIDLKLLKAMTDTIAHRGPDDEGYYTSDHVAFGHRRLSILDLSKDGHQPMTYENKYVITYNGEIYNYLELKELLKQDGYLFTTKTDTEVILAAYDKWKDNCVKYFNGMWAFAIYDKKDNVVFCSRDRFGIKPFYFYQDDEKYYFASEIKSILAAGIAPQVDLDALMDYLIGFTDHAENTFFRYIYQLLPGHNAVLDLRNFAVVTERYYDLPVEPDLNVKAVDYQRLLGMSVGLHLRSDVPVGTCLSGGLDSSTVAAIASGKMKAVTTEYFAAVTAQSESIQNDESDYARQVVEHCGLNWYLTKPTFEDFSQHIEECLRVQEEPVTGPSVFMQYWVMKTAKDNALKVMLDGQGGDETLLGYERYYPAFFWHLLKNRKIYLLLKEYSAAIRNSKLTTTKLTAYTLYFLFPRLRRRILMSRFKFLKRLYRMKLLKKFSSHQFEFSSIVNVQKREIMKYNLPQLLHYEDRNSMAHSIEARVPFVEYNCIEAALSLTPEENIKNGYTKFVLRLLAEQVLPKAIAWRRNKIGFEAPEKLWLPRYESIMQEKVNNSKLIMEMCSQIPILRDLSFALQWKLYNIALWEMQYHVQC